MSLKTGKKKEPARYKAVKKVRKKRGKKSRQGKAEEIHRQIVDFIVVPAFADSDRNGFHFFHEK